MTPSTQLSFLPEAERIPGLCYVPCFVTPAEAVALLGAVDAQPWRTDLKRRVQHYGYVYDYKARFVAQDSFLGQLPEWAEKLGQKMMADGFFQKMPDQMIVNEYQPGQGIAAHIDCEPCFGDVIASVSLGSGCVMDFTNTPTGEKNTLWLEPGSLVVMTGAARHAWQHGIAARKNDRVNGQVVSRGRRVSLTFRNVILTR